MALPSIPTAIAASLSSSPSPSPSSFSPKFLSHCSSPPFVSVDHSVRPYPRKDSALNQQRSSSFLLRAQTMEFSGSFFEGGFGGEENPPPPPGSILSAVEEKEEPQCPPGLRNYESMVVLRPDMSEDERLALTQKYEELLVAGGGMYVEVFNRGVIPLAYSIKKRNRAGETNNYLDGIYLLFTYFTKPESMAILEETLKKDDNVIRSSSFKLRKRKSV